MDETMGEGSYRLFRGLDFTLSQFEVIDGNSFDVIIRQPAITDLDLFPEGTFMPSAFPASQVLGRSQSPGNNVISGALSSKSLDWSVGDPGAGDFLTIMNSSLDPSKNPTSQQISATGSAQLSIRQKQGRDSLKPVQVPHFDSSKPRSLRNRIREGITGRGKAQRQDDFAVSSNVPISVAYQNGETEVLSDAVVLFETQIKDNLISSRFASTLGISLDRTYGSPYGQTITGDRILTTGRSLLDGVNRELGLLHSIST